jgi:hypothetical protein
MNKIEPRYVDFTTAKWLKEIGFDLPTEAWYHRDTKRFNLNSLRFSINKLTDNYAAPEHWELVEWLRVNHGIWISVGNVYSEYTHWAYGIGKENKGMILPFRQGQDNHDYFNTPQKAYSSAFDYIRLNNLPI